MRRETNMTGGRGRLARLAVAALAMVSLAACEAVYSGGLSDIERTWEYAMVALPALGAEAPLLSRMNERDVAERLALLPEGETLPVAVYMHGCTGLSNTGFLLRLAEKGFAVVAPDSFARRYRPLQCDPGTKTGGYNVFVYDFRQAEISFALAQLWTKPWADYSRMVLAGTSEGAVAVALYRGDEFKGRVIAQWTCRGAPLVAGLAAPEGQRVFAVIGADDPWYPPPDGDEFSACGAYLEGRPGSQSLVVEGEGAHDVFEDSAVVARMVHFLAMAAAA